MKRTLLFAAGLLGAFSFSLNGFARLDPKTLGAETRLTAGQLFLNQVDTVALYLSTQNIVYMPRLTEGKKLFVELIFMNRSLKRNPDELKRLTQRHIQTFNKLLQERLQFYLPQLAKEFDSKKDVEFRVAVGAKKEAMALWQNGEWIWIKTVLLEPEESSTFKPLLVAGDPKKKCPALVGAKKKEEAPAGKEPKQEPQQEEPKKTEERPHQGQQNKL